MGANESAIDTLAARRLVAESAIFGASIIGQAGEWSVLLKMGKVETPLATQRTKKTRTWRSLDTCFQYLRDELNILRIDCLDGTRHSEGIRGKRQRADSAARLKHAHKAAAYDKWFREQVREAINDPRPAVAHEDAEAIFEKKT